MLQWKTPALSALVLLGGGFCALAGEFLLQGDHTVTPLKGESALLRCYFWEARPVLLLLLLPIPLPHATDTHPETATCQTQSSSGHWHRSRAFQTSPLAKKHKLGGKRPCMMHILCMMLVCYAAMSYLMLGDLAVNTLRSMVSAQWQDKAAWGTSSAIAAMAEGAKQVSQGSRPGQNHGVALAAHQFIPALPKGA